jgi:hypothetical protein
MARKIRVPDKRIEHVIFIDIDATGTSEQIDDFPHFIGAGISRDASDAGGGISFNHGLSVWNG